jgi:predicted nucleotidyltransferase
MLLGRGYEQGNQPFIFHRRVGKVRVQVDLLAGEYEGTGKSRRHQQIQDIHARKVRGCDLAFNDPVWVSIEGDLPEGGRDSVTVQVCPIAAFLVMKGMAIDDRMKEKDAWDIYFCMRNYPGGLDALAEAVKPFACNALAKEGFQKVARHFASVSNAGPKWVADFEDPTGMDEREGIQRDAFERVNYFLKKLELS